MATLTCNECRFAYMDDYGYSNYTVEGTEFHCLKKLHPEDGFDRWFGDDKRLEYAEQCAGYEKGDPVWMDVDCENDWPEDLDLVTLLEEGGWK